MPPPRGSIDNTLGDGRGEGIRIPRLCAPNLHHWVQKSRRPHANSKTIHWLKLTGPARIHGCEPLPIALALPNWHDPGYDFVWRAGFRRQGHQCPPIRARCYTMRQGKFWGRQGCKHLLVHAHGPPRSTWRCANLSATAPRRPCCRDRKHSTTACTRSRARASSLPRARLISARGRASLDRLVPRLQDPLKTSTVWWVRNCLSEVSCPPARIS